MREFQERRMTRRITQSRFVGVAIFIVLAFLFKGTYSVYLKYRESTTRRAVAERQLKELEDRKALLSENIEKLATDKGVDEEIRRQLNMAKEGEEVALIVDRAGSAKEPVEKGEHWWQKIFHLFGD
jgi:cell division protein FtsB